MSRLFKIENNNNKENPFSVPENYFNNFPERISNRIINVKKSTPSSKTINLQRYVSAAVIIIIALIGGYYFLNVTSDKKLNNEITLLIETELYHISEETILDVMLSDKQGLENNNVDVEDYLLESNIEDLYNSF